MKIVSAKDAVAHINEGASIMIGGFMTNGTPEMLVDALLEKGVGSLTIICNDAGLPSKGVGKLIEAKKVKKLIASHIGLNPEAGLQMHSGDMEITLVPQGTLVEQIRSGGSGLGGVLTPTGLGTEVAIGKEIIVVDGKEYLLEKPLRADVAFIGASIADESGNLIYKGTTRNFNAMMALAADTVIAGAEEIVKSGSLESESIVTPGILVDYLVGGSTHE